MNIIQDRFTGKPSVIRPWCVFCGNKAVDKHHLVYRSQGGKNLPVISVCGHGNASGCHGLLHSHMLHVRWNEESGWYEYLTTEEPVREYLADQMEGWRSLRNDVE